MEYITIESWKSQGEYFSFYGKEIFYVKKGEGESLLILHGYPYSSFEWSKMIVILSKAYSVVVLDLLGMGFSDKPKEYNYSFEEHCEIVNCLMGHIGVAESHILSHDLGVSIAQELIAKSLEHINSFKILSVTFMNGGLFMDVYRPRFIQRMLSQTPNLIGKFISKVISKKMTNKSVKSLFGPSTQPTDGFLEEQWKILNYKDGKEIAYLIGRLVFKKIHYQNRWISAMQTTDIPMCLINGPFDPNSGKAMSDRYRELIPNPKIYLMADHIGHWPFLEDSPGVIKAFSDFQSKLIKS